MCAASRVGLRSLGDEGLDDIEDLLLLRTGQLGDDLECAFGAADRSAAFGRRFFGAEEVLGFDAENVGEPLELSVRKSDGAPFPSGVAGLFDAELVGDGGLRQSGGFAQGVEALAELAAFGLGRTSSLHGRIIRAERRDIALGLHRYRSNR